MLYRCKYGITWFTFFFYLGSDVMGPTGMGTGVLGIDVPSNSLLVLPAQVTLRNV